MAPALVMVLVIAAAPFITTSAAAASTSYCLGVEATIVSNDALVIGTGGDDVIVGGPADQLIKAGSGNDIVCAGGGSDIVYGNSGDDELHGQVGNDLIRGGTGDDYMTGGMGADIFVGTIGANEIYGNADNDLVGISSEDSAFFLNGDDDDINDKLSGGVGNNGALTVGQVLDHTLCYGPPTESDINCDAYDPDSAYDGYILISYDPASQAGTWYDPVTGNLIYTAIVGGGWSHRF